MNRALPAGFGVGLVAGGTLRLAFGSNWFLVAAVVALYAGWGYFAVAYRRLLVSEFPAFDRSTDRLGYGIGLFGLSIGPVAISQQFTTGDVSLQFLVAYLGVVGFLLTSSRVAADLVDGR
ncbi:hypothetical protein [Natrinema gari]|uniref:Uncharacterized protein n=1 Tax=Natrinema gari JCM 14663 TaxID=1230459 RepID=L9Z1Q7_9EURY|nr:hypothetical protein [Natrinema gari]ELY80440.1 hypothetical protein C486_08555 [Natrinema gari JCM 14663]